MAARKYVCSVCGYEFDAEIAANYYCLDNPLEFEDVPIDWRCPVCGYTKEVFISVEEDELPITLPLQHRKQFIESKKLKHKERLLLKQKTATTMEIF